MHKSKTEYRVYIYANCEDHGIEHSVTRFTDSKEKWQNLKRDLQLIYKEDWPLCKTKPKIDMKQHTFTYKV